MFELAAEACKEPYFGLRLGAQLDVRQAGLLGYVALSSPTFGHALKNVVRYHRVLTEGIQLSFEFDQHHAVLAAIPADRSAMVGRQAVEFGTSALVRMCRGLTLTVDGFEVVAVNVTKLRADNVDPRKYTNRLEAWQGRVEAGGGTWRVINDLDRLDRILG